jgi:hypothetical protein
MISQESGFLRSVQISRNSLSEGILDWEGAKFSLRKQNNMLNLVNEEITNEVMSNTKRATEE